MEKHITEGKKYTVYLVAITVNFISYPGGNGWTWASPVIPKLYSTDPTINPLSKPITTFEESLIVSLFHLGSVLGPTTGGMCSKLFGKKKTLLLAGSLLFTAHLLFAFSCYVFMFCLGRIISGIAVGIIFGVMPSYLNDLAEDHNRGIVTSAFGVSNCIGSFSSYVIGSFVSIPNFGFIVLIPVIMFFLMCAFLVPESPYDMIRLNQQDRAMKILMQLRGGSTGQVEKEFYSMVNAVRANENVSGKTNIFNELFRNRAVRRGLLISINLMLFQQFCGICAIISNLQTIFQISGTQFSPALSSIIVGAVSLLSNITSARLIDVAGRKILLVISTLFSMIPLTALGVYFYLQTTNVNVDAISWLPITCLVIFIISFNLGLANIPWIILSELFPRHLKIITSTIITTFCLFLSFIVTIGFPYIVLFFDMAIPMWIFSTVLLCAFVFCLIILPEFKGKSIQEIQDILGGIRK